ncbi:MAG TPA: fluoride efflux transporter CrcB [Herpetosiphonaceae bacterium]
MSRPLPDPPPDTTAHVRAVPHVSASSFPQHDNLAIAAGAVVGVLARFTVGEIAQRHLPIGFPIATLLVNLLGCLLIGIVQALALERRAIRRSVQILLAVGVLGGFTTFSTFSVETVRLLQAGRIAAALSYQGLSLLGGVGAVMLGGAGAHAGYRWLSERGGRRT